LLFFHCPSFLRENFDQGMGRTLLSWGVDSQKGYIERDGRGFIFIIITSMSSPEEKPTMSGSGWLLAGCFPRHINLLASPEHDGHAFPTHFPSLRMPRFIFLATFSNIKAHVGRWLKNFAAAKLRSASQCTFARD